MKKARDPVRHSEFGWYTAGSGAGKPRLIDHGAVVGNVAGDKAVKAIATYATEHGLKVSAFYLSNVEQYLYQDRVWNTFCKNVATLPIEPSSTFIRSVRGGGAGPGAGLNSELGNMQADVKDCGASGQ